MSSVSTSRFKLAEKFLLRAEELVAIQQEIIARLKRCNSSTVAAQKLLLELEVAVKNATADLRVEAALAAGSR